MGKSGMWATVWDLDDGVPVDVIIDPDQFKDTFHVKICKRGEKREQCITFRVNRDDLDGTISWIEEMMKKW